MVFGGSDDAGARGASWVSPLVRHPTMPRDTAACGSEERAFSQEAAVRMRRGGDAGSPESRALHRKG